jgi:polysaccharide pyruvyl transferase WcaK-like protein
LLQSGYKVQLLTGDTTDQVCVDELTTFMASDSVMNYRDQFSFEPAVDLNQLLEQIAGTDVVVASRFHNVLCSLIREKPTLSIGYHAKNDLLMESFGFGEYCQRIDSLDVDRLIKDFKECESRRDTLTCQIRGLVDTYRRSLGGLYDELLSTIVR